MDTVCQFDTLAHVTGLRDSLGRIRGASKRDGATIGRARGKVARTHAGAGTVALRVGRLTRALPCAPIAPADAIDAGARLAVQWQSPAPQSCAVRFIAPTLDTGAGVSRNLPSGRGFVWARTLDKRNGHNAARALARFNTQRRAAITRVADLADIGAAKQVARAVRRARVELTA